MYQKSLKGFIAHMLGLSGKSRAIQNGLSEVRGEWFRCSLWLGGGARVRILLRIAGVPVV